MDARIESLDEDWKPFGRPPFNDPAMRRLTRVGVVDIGSNSVRLVIFDGAARSPAYFFNEKILASLGAGLTETGQLNPTGRRRAVTAIRRFQLLANSLGVSPLTVIATAAVREADDGPEFREEVRKATGLTLHVIPGAEEARLAAQGVLLGWPDASGMVCDIGGSSMELAELISGRVGGRATSMLGPLRLMEITSARARKHYIRDTIGEVAAEVGTDQDRLYLVGGSWRAIARLDMERRGYPLHVMHEYRMTHSSIQKTVKWIADHPMCELRSLTGISETRMSLVPLAGEVLRGLVKQLRPREIAISSYGLREGLLYERMPDELRRRDPLIEACRFAEAKDARMPGFGHALHKFVSPLFRTVPSNRTRIIKAACLLHDVNWRAHPDYRHEACFDYISRASLGGLTHKARIFLGLTLLHRYRNSRANTRFTPLVELLDGTEIHKAEVLGKAMRFGSMLAAGDADAMGELRLRPKKKLLELHLPKRSADLFGEVAEARFHALTDALGVRPSIRIPRER